MSEQTDSRLSAAVESHGGVWHNGNGCQLEEGVATVKRQLEAMRAAMAAQQKTELERLRVNMERESAARNLDASRAALTEALSAQRWEDASDSIIAMIDAVAKWYRTGGR